MHTGKPNRGTSFIEVRSHDCGLKEIEAPNVDQAIAQTTALNHCTVCIHKKLCMTHQMSAELLKQFDHLVVRQRPLKKGKHVYWQGSPFKAIYVVRSGAVKTYRVSPQGTEQVVGFYYPGDLIGVDGLYKDRYINSAITLDITNICTLPFDQVSDFLCKSSDFQKFFLSYLCGEIYQEQKHHVLSGKSVEERVAAFLIALSLRNERHNLSALHFRLVMKRKDMANYLGLAVETVSRILGKFQKNNWLNIDHHEVTLLDKPALVALLARYDDECGMPHH